MQGQNRLQEANTDKAQYSLDKTGTGEGQCSRTLQGARNPVALARTADSKGATGEQSNSPAQAEACGYRLRYSLSLRSH